ncbi:sensor domain-containing diguanylate cyclase [Chitinimonas naiadis]
MPFPIPRPANELQRLDALHSYPLLDTAEEAEFDLLAELAAELCGAPFAFISLVDEERVWYKAAHGLDMTQSPRDDSYCSWAVLEDQILHVPDLSQDARTASISATVGSPEFRMYSGANLISNDGFRVGTLCVLDTKPRGLSERQQALLIRLAHQVVSLMELRKRDKELEAALLVSQRLAREDALSGLLNRRTLLELLDQEQQRSGRFNSPLSVVMVDLDHFKRVNDTLGHAMGDAVIRGVGKILREQIRMTDIAGRYGGEEFCLILPNTDSAGAARLAEALRGTIAATHFEDNDYNTRVTASFGISTGYAGAPDANELLRKADTALYQAKANGRDQVVVTD